MSRGGFEPPTQGTEESACENKYNKRSTKEQLYWCCKQEISLKTVVATFIAYSLFLLSSC